MMLSRVTSIGLKKVAPASAQAWYLRTSVATFARVSRRRKCCICSTSKSSTGHLAGGVSSGDDPIGLGLGLGLGIGLFFVGCSAVGSVLGGL